MKHPFRYYLHDDDVMGEKLDFAFKNSEWKPSDELVEQVGGSRPFYEVTLECELDDETGAVTLVSAKL